jgi:hypothetical protein
MLGDLLCMANNVWLSSPPLGRGFFPDRVLWSDQVQGKVSFQS